jgi:hypothetical protein
MSSATEAEQGGLEPALGAALAAVVPLLEQAARPYENAR